MSRSLSHSSYSFHALMIGIVLLPLIGHTYLPLVDLPNHLSLLRVTDEVLQGQHSHLLQLNTDLLYKPFYIVAFGLFKLLPKEWVANSYLSLYAILYYVSAYFSLSLLTSGVANHRIQATLAGAVSLMLYGSGYFWGLMSLVSAVPFTMLALAFLLRSLQDVSVKYFYGFLGSSVLAHLCHPVATVFLAMLIAPILIVHFSINMERRIWQQSLFRLATWPIAIGLVHWASFQEGAGVVWKSTIPALLSPFHSVEKAIAFIPEAIRHASYFPTRAASTMFAYSGAIYVVLSVAWLTVLVVDARARLGTLRDRFDLSRPALHLGLFALAASIGFVFFRQDLLTIRGPGVLWYEVRGVAVASGCIFVLLSAAVLESLSFAPKRRFLEPVLIGVLLLFMLDRSTSLREHFRIFDREVAKYLSGETDDTFFRQHVTITYDHHIDTYECYY